MGNEPKSIITATAHELREHLESEALTSVDLTKECLAQIEKHNRQGLKLNAIISVCPEDIALAQAEKLDQERKHGKVRSKLHGLPIIVKDAVVTGPALGMPTTAGSAVFASMRARTNAPIVDKMLMDTKLVDAGLIILGKGNMTEFCGMKSDNTPIGWSAHAGQTLSAYRREDLEEKDQPTAGGSSSGPAVSIAAGFCSLAIGTETGGSNVFPASVSGVYAMTLRASVSKDGVQCISESYDGIGVMARDPWGLASLANVLLGPKGENMMSEGGYSNLMDGSWDGLSIGMTRSIWGTWGDEGNQKWNSPDVVRKYEAAADAMRSKGAKVVFPLELPDAEILKDGDVTMHQIAYHEFPQKMKDFISYFELDPKITSLADIIAWNEEHSEQAMPEPYTTQSELIAALNSTITQETHDRAAAAIKTLAVDTLEAAMTSHGIDIILANSDSTIISYAAHSHRPIGAVPLGNLAKNGQPWGFFAVARKGREDVLLRFMAAWHETFPGPERPGRCFE